MRHYTRRRKPFIRLVRCVFFVLVCTPNKVVGSVLPPEIFCVGLAKHVFIFNSYEEKQTLSRCLNITPILCFERKAFLVSKRVFIEYTGGEPMRKNIRLFTFGYSWFEIPPHLDCIENGRCLAVFRYCKFCFDKTRAVLDKTTDVPSDRVNISSLCCIKSIGAISRGFSGVSCGFPHFVGGIPQQDRKRCQYSIEDDEQPVLEKRGRLLLLCGGAWLLPCGLGIEYFDDERPVLRAIAIGIGFLLFYCALALFSLSQYPFTWSWPL